MGALRIISRNIASNAVGYVVAIAVALALTPFVLDKLGKGQFGIWSLVVALTGYYGILDLGIRSAVGQYVTRYWTQRDIVGVSRTLSTAMLMTLPIALLLLLASIGFAYWAPTLFEVEPQEAGPTFTAVLIMGGAVAFSFPFAVFGAAPYARQRFDISNAVGIGERLVNAVLTVWVLSAGYGLVGFAWTTAGTQTAAWLLRVWIAFRLLPGLEISRRRCSRASFRELCNFGIHNFLINVSDRIVLSTDALVIGIMMGEVAVAHYVLGGNFIAYYVMMINSVAWPLTPYATARDAAGDLDALRRLYVSGSKNIFLFAAVVGGGLVFLGHDFIAAWVPEKPEFLSGVEYTSSATVMAVLALATLARGLMTCGKQILFGMREVSFLSKLSVIEAVANLGLSIALVRPLGLLGVALGTLIPILCTQLILQPMFLVRKLGLPLRGFAGHVLTGGVLVIASMGAVAVLVEDWIPVAGWPAFLLKATVVTAPAVLVGAVFGTTRDERQFLLRKLGFLRQQAS